MSGETNWYECQKCGEVIDPKDLRVDVFRAFAQHRRRDDGRHHLDADGKECGPVKVVSG